MLRTKAGIEKVQRFYKSYLESFNAFSDEVESALRNFVRGSEGGEDPVLRIGERVFTHDKALKLFHQMHYHMPKGISKLVEEPQEADAPIIQDFFRRMHMFFHKFDVKHAPMSTDLAGWVEGT